MTGQVTVNLLKAPGAELQGVTITTDADKAQRPGQMADTYFMN